jgi:hypothetical protein
MSSILNKNISPSYIGVRMLAKVNHLFVLEKSNYFKKPRTRIPHKGWQLLYDIIIRMDRMLVENKNKLKLASKKEIKSICDAFSGDNNLLSEIFGTSIREKGYYFK